MKSLENGIIQVTVQLHMVLNNSKLFLYRYVHGEMKISLQLLSFWIFGVKDIKSKSNLPKKWINIMKVAH